jgi:transcriptional regulator with XRE-family HTH domain
VSQSLVSLWTLGKRIPDLQESARLAKLFDVDLGYLADDEMDDPPASEFAEWERGVIELIRAMGLDRREATRRLTTSSSPGYVRIPEGGPFPAAGPEYPNESPQSGRGTPRKKLPG